MSRRAIVLAIGAAACLSATTPVQAQEKPEVAAIRTAAMVTCYPMTAGGDRLAARHSLEAADLVAGPPPGLPAEALGSLLNIPGGTTPEIHHVPSTGGYVAVISAPDAGICSVALFNGDGQAAGAEIDRWFNGPPAPFERVTNTQGEGGWQRAYEGGESPQRPTTIFTTTMRNGYRPEVPLRFLATFSRTGS